MLADLLHVHQIFEKWRVADKTELRGERLAEFNRDREESNRRYNNAFEVVLSHTSAVELEEFRKLFARPTTSEADKVDSAGPAEAADTTYENPMLEASTAGRGSSSIAESQVL